MAAKTTPREGSEEEPPSLDLGCPFPMLTPETRLMIRSIPFSHLRGFGSQPNVSGARAKVDTRNQSYGHLRSRSAVGESEGVRVSSVRADYSHVRSRIDTGRQRTKTAEAELKRSNTDTSTSALASDLSAARRRLTQMQRSATLPLPSSSPVSRLRKVSLSRNNLRLSLKEVRSKVDTSDPHPHVTRQTHTLEQLQILPGLTAETLNPRFQLRQNLGNSNSGAKRSRTFSFPSERVAGDNTTRSGGSRRAKLVKSSTIGPISSDTTGRRSGSVAERFTATDSDKGVARTVTGGPSVSELESSTYKETAVFGSIDSKGVPPVGNMEVESVLNVFEKRGKFSRRDREGDVVKSKPLSPLATSANREGMYGAGNARSRVKLANGTNSTVNRGLAEREGEREMAEKEEPRDSVSSSESVGINPEYSHMDVDTDAFSDTHCSQEDGCVAGDFAARDKIVGFEVSSDPTQTTVNLFHLFGHKDRPTEATRTEYQDNELWVIGEEAEEGAESECEMEEEITLCEGVSGDRVLAVPEVFVVNENDVVVEKVMVGRRRQSRGSLLSESKVTSEPTTLGCITAIQTLSLHN